MANNSIINKMPDREQVKVLHISKPFWVFAALSGNIKSFQVYASTRKEKHEQKTGGQKLKDPASDRLNRWTTSTVPEIKLCGNWLEKLGFIPEQRVNITTMNKLLIIRIDE